MKRMWYLWFYITIMPTLLSNVVLMYLHSVMDKTEEITFQDFPFNTGSSWRLVTVRNKLAFLYQINWNSTVLLVGGGMVLTLPDVWLFTGLWKTDLGTRIDVRWAWKKRNAIFEKYIGYAWNSSQNVKHSIPTIPVSYHLWQ